MNFQNIKQEDMVDPHANPPNMFNFGWPMENDKPHVMPPWYGGIPYMPPICTENFYHQLPPQLPYAPEMFQAAMSSHNFDQMDYKYCPMPQFTAEQTRPDFWKMPNAACKTKTADDTQPKVGPGSNNIKVRTKEKYRSVYSEHQKMELEREFLRSQEISQERKTYLSIHLNLTMRQIKIWFQNRRAKDRREKMAYKLSSLNVLQPLDSNSFG